MDLKDTSGFTRPAAHFALFEVGSCAGITVAPSGPLHPIVRGALLGALRAQGDAMIRAALASPLGCTWQYAEGIVDYAAATQEVTRALVRALDGICEPSRIPSILPSALTPFPVEVSQIARGFWLRLGRSYPEVPGFYSAVDGVLNELVLDGHCASAALLEEEPVVQVVYNGIGTDAVFCLVAERLVPVLSAPLRRPEGSPPKLALLPVPSLAAANILRPVPAG